jgi:hypothetical protein
MLVKLPLVTVIPGTPARAYRAASEVCVAAPPAGTGGDSEPPAEPPPAGGVVPPPGTPILLFPLVGDSVASVAPAPSGYVCHYETVWVTIPGSTEPAQQFNVVCEES